MLYRVTFCFHRSIDVLFCSVTLAFLLYSIFPFVGVLFKDAFLIYTNARLLNQDTLNIIKLKTQTFLENEIFLTWESEPSIS